MCHFLAILNDNYAVRKLCNCFFVLDKYRFVTGVQRKIRHLGMLFIMQFQASGVILTQILSLTYICSETFFLNSLASDEFFYLISRLVPFIMKKIYKNYIVTASDSY